MQKDSNKKQEANTKVNYFFWSYHVVLIVAVLFLLGNLIFKSDKIAYVDSGKIMSEYKGSAAAKRSYQTKVKVWQANIDTLTNAVKAAIQKYEKSVATMSAKEQGLAKQLIDAKQKQLTDYQHAIQNNAREEESKLTESVVSQINALLVRYGKEHNYKMILIANQSGTIAYAREGLDITANVIEELNKEY